MKLEVGMYVRTKIGIFKIRKINKDLAYREHEKRVIELDRNIPEYNYRFSFYKDESIFKGAKFKNNIIDLIEVGDVITTINLCGEVTKINKENNKIYTTCYDGEYCHKEDIKSIVTKEQFESMEYKLGDK